MLVNQSGSNWSLEIASRFQLVSHSEEWLLHQCTEPKQMDHCHQCPLS